MHIISRIRVFRIQTKFADFWRFIEAMCTHTYIKSTLLCATGILYRIGRAKGEQKRKLSRVKYIFIQCNQNELNNLFVENVCINKINGKIFDMFVRLHCVLVYISRLCSRRTPMYCENCTSDAKHNNNNQFMKLHFTAYQMISLHLHFRFYRFLLRRCMRFFAFAD